MSLIPPVLPTITETGSTNQPEPEVTRSSSTVLAARRRTISDNRAVNLSPGFPRNTSTSLLDDKFGRKYSMGRLARIDDNHVFAVQNDGTKFHLEPTSGLGPRPIIRPLSRKDIFYSGSVYKLALDEAEQEDDDNLESRRPSALDRYRHSVVSIPRSRLSIPRGSIVASHLFIPKAYALSTETDLDEPPLPIPDSKPATSVLKEMVDLSHFRNPLFVLMCVSNTLGFLALYIPYMFLPNMISMKGISTEKASFVVSLIGISNTVGRVIIGWFVDFPWVSSLIVTNVSLTLSGICVLVFPFCLKLHEFLRRGSQPGLVRLRLYFSDFHRFGRSIGFGFLD